MTKVKSTKRALFGSALALLLCFTMLLGTTFAWFTDEVKTGSTTITSGTLDIVLEYSTDDGTTWTDAEGEVLNFMKAADAPAGEAVLWEPGCTYKLPLIRVRNNGNLALKYDIVVNGVTGNAKLLEAIDFTANGKALNLFSGTLLTKDAVSETILIQGHMKEEAGNEYQGLTIEGVGITVYATQLTHEYDSFDNQYDKVGTISGGRIEATGKRYQIAADFAAHGVETLAVNVVDANGNIITTITPDAYTIPEDGVIGDPTDSSQESFTTVCAAVTGDSSSWQNTAFVPSVNVVPTTMELVVNGEVVDVCAITYGDWETVVNAAVQSAATSAEMNAAIASGAAIIRLADGTYTLNSASDKAVTLVGGKDAVIDITAAPNMSGSDITFSGVTVLSNGGGFEKGIQHVNTITYENATIVGSRSLYGVKEVFNNCTFDLLNIVDYIWTYGAKEVEFNNCTFNTKGKAILVYNEGTVGSSVVTVNNCSFYATEPGYASGNLCAAVEIDGRLIPGTYTVNINGTNTVSSIFAGIARVKAQKDPANVTVNQNGTVVTTDLVPVSDGLFKDASENLYVSNAAGLEGLHAWYTDTTDASYNMRKAFWGKTYTLMADIDADGVVWKTVKTGMDSPTSNGITFDGHGYTIRNLTIEGNGMFTGATQGTNTGTALTTVKNITFDNVTVTGASHHNGVVWGEVIGDITLENVHVINSKVSGGCNVGGLVGRNSESHAAITFKNCSVKNTAVEATQAADYAGASAFLGMALHIGSSTSANVIFEGTNVAENNTLATASGMQGGGIYTIATWDTATWETPTVVNDFTNYNSNN